MDIQGLSIFDWLLWDNSPCQVTAIGCDYIETTKCGITLAESHLLQGVPLAPEILEKNFERDGERFSDCNEFRDIEITEYNDGMWQVVIDEIEMSDLPTWKMYVCYVHQLQHALRLYGIDKEITI